jgi:hypothetical protein
MWRKSGEGKDPRTTNYHGTMISDPYRWLEVCYVSTSSPPPTTIIIEEQADLWAFLIQALGLSLDKYKGS